ncbi:MAG: hypothetical protein IKZ82_08280 [Clostridia bacterium]|nr:hypothetical protein [Clostridia bacterium]
MNENFKTELAAVARDLREMCENKKLLCNNCELCRDGYCASRLTAKAFDPEAVVAAVENYRKRKKPCAEVIDKFVDIYTIEVELHCTVEGGHDPSAAECSEKLRKHIGEVYYGNRNSATVRVLSAKRFVLESHREDEE